MADKQIKPAGSGSGDGYPKVNTFTSASVRRMADDELTYPELHPHEIAEKFDSDITDGMHSARIKRQRTRFGANDLLRPVPLSFGESLKKQFKNLVVALLLFSSILMYALEQDPAFLLVCAAMLAILLMNAALEAQAGRSLRALGKRTSPRAAVIRDGKTLGLDSRSLVCGDVIRLEGGNFVPADARIIECSGFSVLETPFNGSETPVEKDGRFLAKDSLSKTYPNMVYAGSIVVSGSAQAIVCAVGQKALINSKYHRKGERQLPMLLDTIQRFGRYLSLTSVLAQLVLIATGLVSGVDLVGTFVLALAVGAASLCDTSFALASASLGSCVNDAHEANAEIRNLDCLHELCRIDSILCDKQTAFPPSKIELGNIFTPMHLNPVSRQAKEQNIETMRYLLLCSTLRVRTTTKKQHKKPPVNERFSGNAYTMALLQALDGLGVPPEDLRKDFFRIMANYDSHGEMTRVLGLLDGQNVVIVKGTPEDILSRSVGFRQDGTNCRMDDKQMNTLLAYARDMARTQTVVAVAIGRTNADNLKYPDVENKLVFIGFAGFHTAIEVDGASAIYKCAQAGIETVVRTDDSYYAARTLAQNAGVIEDEQEMITARQMHSEDEGLFIADNGKYKLFLGLDEPEWLYVLRLRRENGRHVAVAASGTEQLPLMKEANISFVPAENSPDTLLHSSDVQMREDGFNTIAETLKIARLAVKRIATTSEYLLVGFLMMFFWAFFSMLFDHSLPFRVQDVLLFGVVANLFVAMSLAFSPMHRDILKEPLPNLSTQTVQKNLALPVVYAVFGALLCMASQKFSSGNAAFSASMVTLFALMFLFSLMCGSRHSIFLNKSYRNYTSVLAFLAGSAVLVAAFYIPSVSSALAYEAIGPVSIAVSLGLAFVFFLAVQAVMLAVEMRARRRMEYLTGSEEEE